jgi:hypothetical protein
VTGEVDEACAGCLGALLGGEGTEVASGAVPIELGDAQHLGPGVRQFGEAVGVLDRASVHGVTEGHQGGGRGSNRPQSPELLVDCQRDDDVDGTDLDQESGSAVARSDEGCRGQHVEWPVRDKEDSLRRVDDVLGWRQQ